MLSMCPPFGLQLISQDNGRTQGSPPLRRRSEQAKTGQSCAVDNVNFVDGRTATFKQVSSSSKSVPVAS
jgi:hypothetical protein